MKQSPKSYDTEVLNHINYVMDKMHDSYSEIYVSLVDREFDELKVAIKKLMVQLEEIMNSVEDEI